MKKKKTVFIKPSVIYVFLFQSDRSFYIGRSLKEALFETYRHHIKMRRAQSAEFINHLSPNRPCLFILEEVNDITCRQAFRRMIVWARLLMDKGYQCYNGQTFLDKANELFFETSLIYEELKDVAIEDIFSCTKCLVPTYRNMPCERQTEKAKEEGPCDQEPEETALPDKEVAPKTKKRERRIRISVTPREYEIILENANAYNMQVAPYIRMVAQNPTVYHIDYPLVKEHTKICEESRKLMEGLVWTIEASGSYLPKEIETFVELMQYIYETEKQLLEVHRHDKVRFYGEIVAAHLEEIQRVSNENSKKNNSNKSLR